MQIQMDIERAVRHIAASNYDIKKTAKIFHPEGKALLRPCIGPYSDRDRLQIIPGLFYMQILHQHYYNLHILKQVDVFHIHLTFLILPY